MSLPLILASSSRYRRSLLERLQLPFTCDSPAIDETPQPGEPVQALTARLALAKAQAVAARHSAAWIIGSDQACVRDGDDTIVGKPGHFAAARAQLLACSGQRVHFHTALVLLNSHSGAMLRSSDVFSVRFRRLSEREIEAYLHKEAPYDCAGSFKAEGLGIALFDGMEGNDFHSLIGLPLISLCALLRQAGLDPLTAATAS